MWLATPGLFRFRRKPSCGEHAAVMTCGEHASVMTCDVGPSDKTADAPNAQERCAKKRGVPIGMRRICPSAASDRLDVGPTTPAPDNALDHVTMTM